VLRHKKVIFDVHEHYPSTFSEKKFFPDRLRSLISRFVRLVMLLFSVFTDRIVFAKKSVSIDFPYFKDRQVLVRNFSSIAYSRSEIKRNVADKDKGDHSMISAIHFGLISRERGWPQILEAMKMIESPVFHLRVIGSFYDGSYDDFRKSVKEYSLEDRVLVMDWMPFEKAWPYMLSSDIGLVLFQPSRMNFFYAFPHKLFDYMLAGLPVIIPYFAREIAPIVNEEECGILVDTSKAKAIAEAISLLINEPSERIRLGNNGHHAVIKKYNWEREAKKLVDMYLDIESNSCNSAK
jgi:glycosyltransferase involved in cell wall biosynthesis